MSRTSLSLAACIRQQDVVFGDLVMVDLFQELKHQLQIKLVSSAVGWLPTRMLCGHSFAYKAAEYYRHLRRRGVTVRGTIDAMERELGLQVAR